MLKYYLKTAFREILSRKFYSIIIILGFAIGLAAWIFVMLWMDYESREMGLNIKSGKMFRIGFNSMESSHVWQDSNLILHSRLFTETPFPLAPYIKKYDSNTVDIARFGYFEDRIVESSEFSGLEKRFAFADPDFFKFFNFPILKGSIQSFFNNKYSVIINKNTAETYFPHEEPVGKLLKINNDYDLKVIAVIKNIPSFYRMQFDLLAPVSLVDEYKMIDNWTELNVNTYVSTKDKSGMTAMYKRINDMIQEKNPQSDLYYMFPFMKYNNYSDIRTEIGLGSNLQFIIIFSAIALYIILIACINYFNISLSTFANRAKEIAVRKSFGSRKRNIVIQFLIEGQILAFISLGVAIIIIKQTLPYFNSLASAELFLDYSRNFNLILKCIVITVCVGIVSSAYSAFYYSYLSPAKILSSSLKSGSKNINFIRFISYIQFTVSIAFMVAAFKVDKQLDHLRNTKEGFDENYSIEIPFTENTKNNLQIFEKDLKTNPDIIDVLNDDKVSKTNNNIIVKIKPIRIAPSIVYISEIWEKYNRELPFEYKIQDADLRKEFTRETIMRSVFNIFTLALIIVTSLGFICFSSFISEQRKYEIAIRKAYGASSLNIYLLIIKDFLIIGLLSVITAHLFVFFTSITWLNNFTSKISEFGVSEYVVPTAAAIILLILTVSYHAIMASLKSPAKVLRGE